MDEEFTANKKMTSLSLRGTPFHVKFVKNYFGFVLSSNLVVTYAMLKLGGGAAAQLAAPVCLWQAAFHISVLYVENGSRTYKSLHLPLHTGPAALWGFLGLGVLASRHRLR